MKIFFFILNYPNLSFLRKSSWCELNMPVVQDYIQSKPYQRNLIGSKLWDSGPLRSKTNNAPTPEQNHQVHHQEDVPGPGKGGRCGPGTDIVKSVAVLALAELPFNRNTLQGVLFS